MPNLLLTEECNKNCSFCFAGPSSGNNPEHRDSIDLPDVVRFARWCSDNDVNSVGLLGGEPLLYHSFNEVLEIFDRNGVAVQLISNFTYPAPDRNLNHPVINIYLLNSAALQNDSDLERFKENLMRLTPENRRKVGIGYTIASADEDFSDVRELTSEFPIQYIRVDFATPGADDEDKSDPLSPEEKREMLRKVFDIARENDTGISFDCNLATQIKVLFSEEERKNFIEDDKIRFHQREETCGPIVDVDVDLSAFHCFPLRDVKIDNILDYSLKEAKAYLAGEAARFRNDVQEHCIGFNRQE